MAPLRDSPHRTHPRRLAHKPLPPPPDLDSDSDIIPSPKRQKLAQHSGSRQKWVPGGRGGGGRRVSAIGQGFTTTLKNEDHYFQPTRPRTPWTERPVRSSSRRTMTTQRQPRYATATAAAAAVDGYKPREERGWEEFHPALDLTLDLPVVASGQVDGLVAIPSRVRDGQKIEDIQLPPPQPEVPLKRRPGRPPRRPDAMLNGLRTPDAPRRVPPPGPNPRERLTLPRPSYKEHDPFLQYEQKDIAQMNFVDRSMAAVGYQESEIFVRPENMPIRLMEGSIAEDLELIPTASSEGENMAIGSAGVGRVEYDMDEQDTKWLEALNKSRKLEQVEAIKPAIFEITMTKIEKEWYALEKRIPRNDPKPPQTQRPRSSSAAAVNGEAGGDEQDSKCAICDDGDCENANAIVFCDGCDLAVHQECYGVPYIPEGQWLCRKCQLIGRGTPTCIFCPNTEGAFKQTNNAKWAHLLCACWIPEVNIGNMSLMEPVLDVEKVPSSRWKLHCFICQQKMGACIQCSHRNCYQAFHPTCARRARMYLKMKNAHGLNSLMDQSQLKALCDKHVSAEWRLEHDTERATADAKKHYQQTMKNRKWAESQASALAMGPAHEVETSTTPRLVLNHGGNSKRAKMQKAVWRLPSGAPVIPDVICQSICASLQRFSVRKKKDFVAEVSKYWTMKREARRGATLLKRLQLQMDAFSTADVTRKDYAGYSTNGRARLERRIDFAEQLHTDCGHALELVDLVKQREATKLEDALILQSLVDTVFFPIPPMLRPVLDKAVQLDPKHVFYEGLQKLYKKLANRSYISVATFSADVARVLSSDLGVEATSTAELQEQVSGRAPEMSLEQRERRKLAKRIIKAVQPALEEALRNESELNGRPFEKQLRELDMMLEGSVLSRRDSLSALEDQLEVDELTNDKPADSSSLQMRGGATNEIAPAEDADNDVEMVDAPIEEAHEHVDAAIAHLNGDLPTADPIMTDHTPPASTNGIKGYPPTSDVPAGRPAAEPPTPPLSLGEQQQSVLASGGIPWYVEPFDVDGTTIHEERWTGREVLRELSEELSDMDEDELADLGGDDAGDEQPEVAGSKNPAAGNKNTKKNGKARRRWRGYR